MTGARASSLHIRSALLADYAKVEQSGLLSIVGGGISDVSVVGVPAQLNLAVVLQLVPQAELKGIVTLEVRRPTGDRALTIQGKFALEMRKPTNVALNLNLLIDTPGAWGVSVSFGDGQPSVELPFNVALGPTSE